jgi:uncharacterized protein YjdB
MSTFQFSKKNTVTGGQDHDVVVQMQGDTGTAPGAGYTAPAAAQNHKVGDASDASGVDGSKVLYHEVRDAMYALGVTDMSKVKINVKRVTALAIAPTTVAKVAGQTQQLTPTFTPTDASNRGLTYKSDNTAKATVSASGLVTGVAVGTCNIIVTAVDTGIQVVIPVTIS